MRHVAYRDGKKYMKSLALKDSIYKTELSHIIVILGFIILLCNKYANLLDIDSLHFMSGSITSLLGIMMIACIMLFQRKSLLYTIIFLLSLYSWSLTKDTTLVALVLFAATSKILRDRLLKVYLTMQSTVLVSCIILYFLSLYFKMLNVNLYTTGNRIRYTFFFLQPNNFGIQFAFTIICFIFISKLPLAASISILLFSSLFLYVFPNCITGCMMLIIYALLILCFNKIDFLKKELLHSTPYFIIAMGILIFGLYFTGKASLVGKIISGTFSYRFIGSVMAIRLYGVNLTVHYLDKLGEVLFVDGQWGTFWLDFAYIRVLVEFGIIGASIFAFIIIYSIRFLIRHQNYEHLILLIVVLFYGLSEWGAFSALTAFPLLYTVIPSSRIILCQKNNSFKGVAHFSPSPFLNRESTHLL